MDQLTTTPEPQKSFATIELAKEWRKYYLKEGHTVHSTTTYYNYIRLFVEPVGIEITQKTVDKFRDNHYSSASSGALKSFFNFLVSKQGFPGDILMIRFGKNKSTRKFPEGIQQIEVEKIIAGMGQEELKSKIMTIFLYELALRVSEVLKLTFADFNWATWLQDRSQYGTVNIKYTKRNNFRTLPVKPYLMEMLYDPRVSHNKTSDGIPVMGLVFDFGIRDYVLKERSNDENVYHYIIYAENRYRKLLKKVSLATLGKKIHPHMFRHAKAQLLTDKSMPIESIKVFLGHQTIATTEIYTKSSAAKLTKDLKEYDKAESS